MHIVTFRYGRFFSNNLDMTLIQIFIFFYSSIIKLRLLYLASIVFGRFYQNTKFPLKISFLSDIALFNVINDDMDK